MNKVGVQSQGSIRRDRLEESYRMVKDAGFDCVDFNFDEYLPCGAIRVGQTGDILDRPIEEIWEDFKPHAEAAAKYGLSLEQMHAPFPVAVKGREEVNEKLLRIMLNTMEIGARMGGRYIVYHPVTLAYQCSAQEERAFNLDMYRKLIPTARKLQVTICLENMFLEVNQHLMEGACSDFCEAASMIDELNGEAGEERFGFCFDVGHANILGKNMYQSVVALGSRLKILHIHDNDGVSDLHTMPYTFMRGWSGLSTDWDGFLRGLKEIGYQGILDFETNRCMAGFPEELHPSVLRLLADTGKYFAERIGEEA